MQPAHGSIRLPCAAMKGLSHFSAISHAAVRAHSRLLPISPVVFKSIKIRTVIARNGQKLAFQDRNLRQRFYDDLRLSVIVHHPCTAIFKTNRRRCAQVSNTSCIEASLSLCFSTPQSPQSATSVMESFQNRECVPPLLNKTNSRFPKSHPATVHGSSPFPHSSSRLPSSKSEHAADSPFSALFREKVSPSIRPSNIASQSGRTGRPNPVQPRVSISRTGFLLSPDFP